MNSTLPIIAAAMKLRSTRRTLNEAQKAYDIAKAEHLVALGVRPPEPPPKFEWKITP